ncbi:Bug family tripartite tricarboxylate transporter substrate binding protein [Variovorax sp. GB1P17]|uniref:Bug family tripartite tricarboxylate transporter substrate binding protein n=1 Tax=Variovorax sp. GB1P17 TaxID=3443740 RepID=UPI003F463079
MRLTPWFNPLLLCVATCIAPPHAAAQSYPTKPVKIVVPFSPASSSDNTARSVTERLTARFKQPFIVDNRVGAGGTIGVAAVARSPADGYTLLLTTSSPLVINPLIDRTVSYDVEKDLIPVAMLSSGGLLLVSSPKVPAKNLKELIALIRKSPGTYSYASNGNGSYSHMAMELFKQMAELDMVHVPYKGPAQAETDVMAGQVTLMFDAVATGSEQIKANRLRAYGISSLKPDAIAPQFKPLAGQDIPELKGFDVVGWSGVLAPRGTPAPVVEALAAALRETVADPVFRDLMARRNASLVAPEETGGMARQIRSDRDKWEALVKSAQIRLEP